MSGIHGKKSKPCNQARADANIMFNKQHIKSDQKD
jgi:hypothetical protein